MPVVEIPSLSVAANAIILGPGSDALTVATLAAAWDEDFLLPPDLVDRIP